VHAHSETGITFIDISRFAIAQKVTYESQGAVIRSIFTGDSTAMDAGVSDVASSSQLSSTSC
jgi:hypothetical protein